jgi:SAM-dependent methyltransferase
MIIFKRLKNSLRQNGLRMSILKLCLPIYDLGFDIKYQTDTCKWATLDNLTIKGDNKDQGAKYQPTRIFRLRKLFSHIKPMIASNSVFVDLGCGKGRALCIASEFGFREVIGVEFAHELCNIARNNCAGYNRVKGFKTEFRIINSDVIDYKFNNNENVFFMYNPFNEIVLKSCLNNLIAALEKQPRRILIIYCNPRHKDIIEQYPTFEKVLDLDLWAQPFVIYSNAELFGNSNNSLQAKHNLSA